MEFANTPVFISTARPAPPREIAFLAASGAPLESLFKAGRIVEDVGVSPDCALLREGLAQEEFFYRALADRLGAPFHVGGAPLDTTASPARALNAGFVYLQPLGAPYRDIAAPRGEALRLLLEAADAGRTISGLALTSPRRLGALVRVERGARDRGAAPRCTLWSSSTPRSAPTARCGPKQTARRRRVRPWHDRASAFVAPWAERVVIVASAVGRCFPPTIFLRFAAVDRRRRRRDRPLRSADADLPDLHRDRGDVPRGRGDPQADRRRSMLSTIPKSKLDIKFVIESQRRTRRLAAIVAERLAAALRRRHRAARPATHQTARAQRRARRRARRIAMRLRRRGRARARPVAPRRRALCRRCERSTPCKGG